MGARRATRRSARGGILSGSVVGLVLAHGACISKPATELNGCLRGPGLAVVLSQLDAGQPDAESPSDDAAVVHQDAQDERGCADGRDCPTGMVLAMATYSPPCSDRVIACRRTPSSEAVWLSGDFTRGNVDAIVALIARVDRQPLLSIGVHGDVAVAKTGCASACVVNSGWLYRLRRVAKTWAITERSMEVE